MSCAGIWIMGVGTGDAVTGYDYLPKIMSPCFNLQHPQQRI